VEILTPLISITLISFLLVLVYVLWGRTRQLQEKLEDASGSRRTGKAELVYSEKAAGTDALFATLSHELRTPLNGLLGIAQMLNEEKFDQDIEAMEGCARHMLSVLTALVNHYKIQTEWEDLPEYREWVSPFELLEQIKKHLSFRADLRGLLIKIEHQDRVLRLRGDYDHLRNIIENAILGSLESVSLVDQPKRHQELEISWTCENGEMRLRMFNPLEEYSDERRKNIRSVQGLTTGQNHARIRMEYLYWAVSSQLLERYKGALFSRPVESGGVETLISFEMEQMRASPSSKLPIGGLELGMPGH